MVDCLFVWSRLVENCISRWMSESRFTRRNSWSLLRMNQSNRESYFTGVRVLPSKCGCAFLLFYLFLSFQVRMQLEHFEKEIRRYCCRFTFICNRIHLDCQSNVSVRYFVLLHTLYYTLGFFFDCVLFAHSWYNKKDRSVVYWFHKFK